MVFSKKFAGSMVQVGYDVALTRRKSRVQIPVDPFTFNGTNSSNMNKFQLKITIDSESEMLGYGIGIILLNIGMYFVAPAVLIMKVRKN